MQPTWNEQLKNLLIQQHGHPAGQLLYEKYANAFSIAYTSEYTPDIAANDISHIEQLSPDQTLNVNLYSKPETPDYPIHIRLFQWQETISLSDILPTLENLGLRTYNVRPNKIIIGKNQLWISDFAASYSKSPIDIEKVKPLFQDALIQITAGSCENDGFNKLILGATLAWHDIIILRAYAKYLHQCGFRFSQTYIESALANHADIAKNLVEFFKVRHDPAQQSKAKSSSEQIEKSILHALESVTSLDEDRILRRFLDLINATLRTNYFQTKPYLSLKLNSELVPELPLPIPLYEVFVYSPRFEAIHLRNAKVARGGIRWSDRREDFRTEILGLMKAQKVKNAIIVPSGAKGGFVLKHQASKTEVIECYTAFISGLLDITDNIKNKKVIRPDNVVCYDDIDTYLVVAADKGTATFSDIANGIANRYQFWLGDAFASGGSAGYDHKKMGITARGAWESIKRHFRECDLDILTTNVRVIGIGDMSGDVFGNGMLYSKHIQLVGAFDHRHIFIDPDPNPELSYQERLRLFNLPTSSWEDYSPSLISQGGGVFKRSLKAIPLTPQMKTLLAVDVDSLTPNDLIRALLKAPVDLLYNGGIGTYVKATTETAADVGDRTNDYCRVNGGELRCKVVGEGGNLGFTQLGRIEYALNGGLINTDFIDNSGGVDCSDHEVNLKILLEQEVSKGDLSESDRNKLLASLTQEVADLVLKDNYFQALVMSFSAYHAKHNAGLHQNYIKELESLGVLNRKVEFLPDDKTINERKAAGLGLTRPELATLLAYSKIHIKNEILKSNLTDDNYLKEIISTAFPKSLREKYKSDMLDHHLHANIIATQLSNHIVNQMGFTFIYRLQMETGATVDEIIRAYTVSSRVFGTTELQQSIEALDFKLPLPEQYDMLYHIRNLLNLSTRWFLRSPHMNQDLSQLIAHYASRIKVLEDTVPRLMVGYTKNYRDALVDKFSAAGLSVELAKRIGGYRAMYTSLNIIDISTKYDFDLLKTAHVYLTAGDKINLVWFRDQIAADSRGGHWNILARLSLRDELDVCQRAFAVAVLKANKKENDVHKLLDLWFANNPRALSHWEKLSDMVQSSSQIDYTMIFIAMRELLGLIQASR